MKTEWTGERLETGVHSQVTAEHLHRYALAMEFTQNKIVLDIACGEGYGSYLLAQKSSFVTAVDIDAPTINKANNKYKSSNLSFQTGTVEAIPMEDDSVDVVVSFETLEHTASHQQFLSEIKRVLKPGGLLLLSTPDKKWYSDKTGYVNPFHVKELYRNEFEELIRKNFIHSNFLTQKFLNGSMIASDANHQPNFYTGNFKAVLKQDSLEAPYIIAIASDSNLPGVPTSFFNAGDILEQAIVAKEMDVKNSMSYKIGHLILSPAKWIKKLFKNS